MRRSTLVILVAVLLVLPSVGAFGAWPFGSSCGGFETAIDYTFDSSWNQAPRGNYKDEVAEGLKAWRDQVRTSSGVAPFVIGSGTNYTITWTNLGQDGPLAQACALSQSRIEFNSARQSELLQSAADFQGIATHEWGHVMGFRHTGIHDGYVGSQRPTMSTCQPTSESDVRNSLSRDDEAAIQWATDSVFSNFHTFTPNPSFEETPGTQYWNANNGLTFSTSTAGGGVNGTPSYAVIRQYQDTSHLALTTRWVAGGNVGPDSWDDITIYARINVRKAVSVSQGNVRVRHVYRTVNYPGFTELCQFPEDENGDGIDLNSDQTSGPILGPWTYSDPADCPPQYTTSWTESCDTQHEYLNSTLTIDAWDVRINVYPRMTGTFSPFPPVDVHVDRTRVMVND